MRPFLSHVVALVGILALSSALAAPKIYVAYPDPTLTVGFDHVLLEGSVPVGTILTLNGAAVDTAPDGLFIEWVPLNKGLNVLKLESSLNGESTSRELKITSSPTQSLPQTPTVIREVSPTNSVVFYGANAQLVQVSFSGAAGGQASFGIGKKGPFKMLEKQAENFPSLINPETHQPLNNSLDGRYEGSYVVQPNDVFSNAEITVSLKGKDGKTVTASAAGKVSVGTSSQPRVGIYTGTPDPGVSSTLEVARNGLEHGYILFPRQGTKFMVTGEEGNSYQAKIAPNQYVTILKSKVRLLPVGAAVPQISFTTLKTARVNIEGQNATQIRFLLPDIVPYSIEQNISSNTSNDSKQTSNSSGQGMDIRLYGVESNVDYMIFANPDPIVRNITWRQEQDGVFLAQVDLKVAQQWGYTVFYEANTLVIQIKDPPAISLEHPLKGHKIALDPGHGGKELGAPGGLGIYEKEIVLSLAQQTAEKLRAMGAEVLLTREKDIQVDLYDRSIMAQKWGAEVLVSIHCNAIPNGVDPNTVGGAGGYYFQPQSRGLAQSILESITTNLPNIGNDGVHYQNLALTRPTQMPQVLIETGFMVNKDNLRTLMSLEGQNKYAEAIAKGIENFYRTAGSSQK